MKTIIRKELYRIPITSNIIKELLEVGLLDDRRRQILSWILYNKDLSHELKMSWCQQFLKEFEDKLKPISNNVREKLNLLELENIIQIDFENNEIVVLDITKDEYQKLLKKHKYMCALHYKEEQTTA